MATVVLPRNTWFEGSWDAPLEGVRIVQPKESPYVIIRQDRTQGTLPNPWFRSIVVEKSTSRVVCVAPPKATPLGAEGNTTVVAEEFVDGSMINLFWVPGSEEPVLTTRSRLGADNHFYGTKSFKEMLTEAVTALGFANLAELKPFSEESVFLSVVLQHPENRIVQKITEPRIVVVHAGIVRTDGTVEIYEDPATWSNTRLAALAPKKAEGTWVGTLEELQAGVEKTSEAKGYEWQGVVFRTGDGTRSRLRARAYTQVRALRGNDRTPEERFARCRTERSIQRYLEFFPEEKDLFYKLEGALRTATRKVFKLYVDTFKFKKTEFHTLPWPFKHHVSVIHNRFKETLRPERKTVDLNYVIQYVNQLNREDTANLLKK